MDDTQRIREETPDQAYFAIIPHIVDELLGPYEYRLYGHYRRVCGEGSRGRCYEKTVTTAEKTGMSVGKIAQARRILEDLGMIRVHQRKVRNLIRTDVTLLDLWPVNMKYFTVQDMNDGVQRSPHERYRSLSEHYRSLSEHYRSSHERYRSPHERLKNNQGEEELREEELREEELREEELSDDDGLVSTLPLMDAGGVQGGVTVAAMRTFAAESAANLLGDTWDGQERAIQRMGDEQLIALVEWLDYYDEHYERLSKKLDNPVGYILSRVKQGIRPANLAPNLDQRILDNDIPRRRHFANDGEALAAAWDRFIGGTP